MTQLIVRQKNIFFIVRPIPSRTNTQNEMSIITLKLFFFSLHDESEKMLETFVWTAEDA
jgi:hypothetical protein